MKLTKVFQRETAEKSNKIINVGGGEAVDHSRGSMGPEGGVETDKSDGKG